MNDQSQEQDQVGDQRMEPVRSRWSPRREQQEQRDQMVGTVRSRWSPKTEQIRILETIFNSGMVNPPKDETVRIRKLLEEFGPVVDANVFYWFQNRRSRSRRRQRQVVSLSGAEAQDGAGCVTGSTSSPVSMNTCLYVTGSTSSPVSMNTGLYVTGSTSSPVPVENDHAHFSGEFLQSDQQVQQFEQNHLFCSTRTTNFSYPESITVFINGVAMEVGQGGLDIKGVFGEGDFMMFHSSGVPVEVNEYGYMVQSLQHGESYFLFPRVS